MNIPKLEVIFSKEFEVERVMDTLSKRNWFNENSYNIHLPKPLEEDREYSASEVSNAVDLEFDESFYDPAKKYLEENWGKASANWGEFENAGLKIQSKYIIHITRYGVGGSYNLPNIVVVKVDADIYSRLIRIIFHEIVHLAIQDLIEKYRIDHWQKERVVDLLIKKIAPQLSKMQNVPIDTEKIDALFSENYPNIDMLLNAMSQK